MGEGTMKRKKKLAPVDWVCLVFFLVQVGLVWGKLAGHWKISWWVIFIPGYPVAALILLAFFGFGMLGWEMDRHG